MSSSNKKKYSSCGSTNEIDIKTNYVSMDSSILKHAREMGIDTQGNKEIEHAILKGFYVELEHGSQLGPDTNVTHDDIKMTIRIVLAHIKEFVDYYDRLDIMERRAKRYWKNPTGKDQQLKNEWKEIFKHTTPNAKYNKFKV